MKAPACEILRPATLDAALAHLAEDDEACILAGGQSLVPSLNLRLNAPARLIDINHIPGLDHIRREGNDLVIGPLVRHVQLARSDLVAETVPLLSMAIAHVAHPAIRNRGTICGSLAHADPAAELPACAVTLDAVLELASRRGRRRVRAREFYLGLYETARAPDEMLVAARFPIATAGDRFGFEELARQHGGFAIIGAAARARTAAGRVHALDLVIFGSEPAPHLCRGVARALEGQGASLPGPDALAALAAAEIDPMDNLEGDGDTKRRMARALVRRILTDLLKESGRD